MATTKLSVEFVSHPQEVGSSGKISAEAVVCVNYTDDEGVGHVGSAGGSVNVSVPKALLDKALNAAGVPTSKPKKEQAE